MTHPEIYNQKYGFNIQDVTHACWGGSYTVHTSNLQQALERLKAQNNLPLDTHALATVLLHSPDLFEAQRVAGLDEKPCEHPEQFIFWDQVHASAVTHTMLAKTLIEFIETENTNGRAMN